MLFKIIYFCFIFVLKSVVKHFVFEIASGGVLLRPSPAVLMSLCLPVGADTRPNSASAIREHR